MDAVKVDPRYSERRACGLVRYWRSSYRYRRRKNDEALRLRVREWVQMRPRFGYRRVHEMLRRERDDEGRPCWRVNIKRVYRIYRAEGLAVRRRKRETALAPVSVAPPIMPESCPAVHGHRWAHFASREFE